MMKLTSRILRICRSLRELSRVCGASPQLTLGALCCHPLRGLCEFLRSRKAAKPQSRKENAKKNVCGFSTPPGIFSTETEVHLVSTSEIRVFCARLMFAGIESRSNHPSSNISLLATRASPTA